MDVTHVPQIVTFQITPYSDETASYVNSLSEEEIYRLFSIRGINNEILTAALYAVYKYEFYTKGLVRDKKDITLSYTLKEAELRCPGASEILNLKILLSLADVFIQDDALFSQNLNALAIYPNAFVLVVDGTYSGHIYAWTINNPSGSGKVTNVIGIRTSMYQLLTDICKLRQFGVAPIFFDAIRRWVLITTNHEPHYIRVLQPIGPMPSILTKCGFISIKGMRNQDGMNWLFDNSSLGNIPMVRMLIFREYDYIINITKNFNCNVPAYSYHEIF